jgi:hypothetical protein
MRRVTKLDALRRDDQMRIADGLSLCAMHTDGCGGWQGVVRMVETIQSGR